MKYLLIALPLVVALGMAPRPNASSAPGDSAPSFSLTASDGKTYDLKDQLGHYVVIEWTNKDCPFVKKHYNSGNMQKAQEKAKEMGATWFSIVSSGEGSPGYVTADEANAYRKANKVKSVATLLDSDGKIGKLYKAKATPQIVVVDPKGTVIYNGAIDNKPTPDESSIDGATNYPLQALDESMAGKAVSVPTSRPYGCGIKYAE